MYQKALAIALTAKGLSIEEQYPLSVSFRGQIIGQFFADILVEQTVLVEIKAVSCLAEIHKAQLINYIKATGMEIGLLVNFGNQKLEFCRFDNRFEDQKVKKSLSPLHPLYPCKSFI